MAEKSQRVRVGPYRAVEKPVPLVAVAGQQRVKLRDDVIVSLADVGGAEDLVFFPVLRRQEPRVREPVLRQPVPGDAAHPVHVRAVDGNGELLQPVVFDCRAPGPFERRRGGGLRPAERGDKIVPDLHRRNALSQKRGLAFAGLGQAVVRIIGVAVADDQQFHRDGSFTLFSSF